MKSKKLKFIFILGLSATCLTACDLSKIFGNSSSNKPTQNNTTKQFALYRADTNEEIDVTKTLEIETYNDFYFSFEYNGEQINASSIVSSDNTIVYPHSKSVYPRKEGSVTLTLTYNNNAFGTKSYTLNVVSSCHNKVSSIYVSNGADGIKIGADGNAVIEGKVFSKTENGIISTINNNENLSVTTENGSNENNKKVTLTYTVNGINYTASYNVPITNTVNTIGKTSLKQNFLTYWNNGIYKNYPKCAATGTLRLLSIPVWFTDSSKYINETKTDIDGKNHKEQIIADLEQMYFGDPIRAKEQTLKSYYYDESFGNLKIAGTVSDWFTSTYASTTNFFSNSSAREGLYQEALDWYFGNHPEESSLYDVVIINYGSNHYGEESNLYGGFQNSINKLGYANLKCGIFASALGMYGIDSGESDYLELGDLSDLRYNDSTLPTTIIHEIAHTMGAIDTYSDSRVNGSYSRPCGIYTMQSSDYAGHDTFNLLAMGWANPYILSSDVDYGTNSITLTIDDIQSSGDCIILSPSWNSFDSPFDEYIAIDLFASTGVNTFVYNPSLPSGVRVYHVDARLVNPYSGKITTDATTSDVIMPFSNTRGVANGTSNFSSLNVYADVDAVHLIRANNTNSKKEEIEYFTEDRGNADTWFQAKDSFDMSTYAKQFYVEGKFDTNIDLGWTFKVDSITNNPNGSAKAVITFTKA